MANKIGIVLALDGEREFTQGMKNAKAASKELDTQINDLKKTYADNANSLEALSKKQELLKQKQEALKNAQSNAQQAFDKSTESVKKQGEAVDRLTKELEEEQRILSSMSKTDPGYAKQQAAVQKVSNALDKQKANLLQAQQQQNKWNTELAKSKGAVAENTTEINKNAKYVEEAAKSADKHAKSLDKMGDEAKEAGEKSKTMGESLKTALAVAAGNLAADAVRALKDELVEAAKYVIDVGSSFEAAMSEVEAISGASTSEIQRMAAAAKELGSSTKFSASEVAAGFKYMSLAGWSTEQSLAAIGGVLDLSAASGMDLAKTTDMLTDYLSAFGKEAKDAGKMADEMAYAQSHSNTSVEQLGAAYQNSAANLHAAGQEMETTTALLEAMANQGDKGSRAGTGLAAVMADITKSMENGKIQIGDTAVSVMDASGNFRNLIDILGDVESAVNGMGTAERTAALSGTFQRKSIVAVNEVLTEGVSKIKGYEKELYNASGTAEKMAATMQNNLKGATTKFNSALEGLGIAVYEKISGPLTAIVNLGSDIISGLTAILDPAKTELEQYMDDVQGAIDGAAEAVDAASITMANAFASAERVSTLGSELENLNSAEEKTAEQKARIRELVDQLKDSVPGLADAFDKETGALELTNAELDEMLNKSIDTAIETALQTAKQTLYAGELEAIAQKQSAESNLEIAKRNHAAAVEQYDALSEAYDKYVEAMHNANYAGDTEETMKWLAEADKQQAVIEGLGYSVETYKVGLNELSSQVASTAEEEAKATTQYEELSEAVEGFAEKRESMEAAAEEMAEREKSSLAQKTAAVRREVAEREKLAAQQKAIDEEMAAAASDSAAKAIMAAKKQGEEVEKTGTIMDIFRQKEKDGEDGAKAFTNGLSILTSGAKENTAAVEEDTDAIDESTDAAEEATDAHKRFGDAFTYINGKIDAATESYKNHKMWQEKLGETAEKSAEAVKKAWDDMKEAASQKISFDLFSGFNGGTDQTTEQMNANLQSQIDGLEQYYNDLRTVSQHIGKEVTPEFFQYIEEMGTDGANLLRHMVWTLENQGEDGVKQIVGLSQRYAKAMNWKDIIAAAIAGDTAALQEGLQNMGSSKVEFTALETAIDSGLSKADEGMKSNLEELVNTAETVGATIPEGLTDAINNGEISAEDVQSQLESAISGAVDGVASIIEEQGGKVPEGLVEGIKDGSADVGEAWKSLMEELSGSIDTSSITEIGTTVSTSIGGGISENASVVSGAVKDAMSGAKTEGDKTAKSFDETGKSIDSSMAAGVSSGSSQVSGAAQQVVSDAKSAANSGAGQTGYIGMNMALGVAGGISSGGGIVASAARSIISQAIAAMRAEAVIRSPSRRTRDEVGKLMGKGTAIGIALSTEDVKGASVTMIEKTVNATVKAAKGKSEEIRDALWSSVTDKSIAKRFGISKYDVSTDSKGNTTKTKKTAGGYNSDILQAARAYYKQLETYQDMSLTSELAYWKKVLKQLTVGTDAYAEVAGKVKELKGEIDKLTQTEKEQAAADKAAAKEKAAKEKAAKKAAAEAAKAEKARRGNFDAMSAGLDTMKIYWDINAAQEVEYWGKVRKNYKKGTDDRIKADQKYFDAKRSLIKELENIEKDYAKTIKDIDKRLAQDRENTIKQHIQSIMSSFGLFDAFESKSETGEQLLVNMESQAEGYKLWETEFADLESRGILSNELLKELKDEGPKAIANIIALNSLNDEDLERFQTAYSEKMDVATRQGTIDSQEEIKELERIAQEDREEADRSRKEQTAALIGNLDANQILLSGTVSGSLNKAEQNIIAALKSKNDEQAPAVVAAAAAKSGSGSAIASKTAKSSISTSQKKTAQQDDAKKNRKQAIQAEITAIEKKIAEAKRNVSIYESAYRQYKNAGKTNKAKEAYGQWMNALNEITPLEDELSSLKKRLKSGSYRTGTKRILEDYAWMDEEGAGSEAIIRASDNAILRYVGKGSAITDARTTENIFDWGKFNPADLTDLVSAAALNASLQAGYSAGGIRSGVTDARLDDVVMILADYLPFLAERQTVILSRSEMSDTLSTDLAMRSRRRR